MRTSRRAFVGACTAAAVAPPWLSGQGQTGRWRAGVTDWDIQQTGKVEALEFASRTGFDGVEVSLGRRLVEGRLPLDDADLQTRYLAAAAQQRIQVSSTCLDALHTYFLKSDKLAAKLLPDAISISRQLKAPVVLAPMFGKGVPSTTAEFDYLGDLLRELGPEAEKAGITLALEDTLSADDNLRIMERSRSNAVKVYFDTGNSANQGYDVIAEIRSLGKRSIAQVHFKDGKSYLGEGKIDFAAVARVLSEIGYLGYIVLETPSPSGSIEADMRRNLAFVRDLIRKTA
jgi:sugar phosphate isomerase/epimerase